MYILCSAPAAFVLLRGIVFSGGIDILVPQHIRNQINIGKMCH